MIEMNLVDSQAYVIGNYTISPLRRAVGTFFLTIILVSIPVGAIYGAKKFSENYKLKILDKQEVEKPVVQEIPKEKIRKPSQEKNVEEIIDNVGSIAQVSMPEENYDEMAKWERINYEVKFNAMLLDEFTQIVEKYAPAMTFNDMKISDYKLLVVNGTAPDKETISALLSKLKTNGFELQPKPRTNISDGGSFYYFHIETEYYPLPKDVVKLPINPANIPDLSRLGEAKEKIVETARKAGLRTQGLVLEKSFYEPDIKEYTYNIKVEGAYGSLLLFVKNLASISVPVRCNSVSIKSNKRLAEGTVTLTINVR